MKQVEQLTYFLATRAKPKVLIRVLTSKYVYKLKKKKNMTRATNKDCATLQKNHSLLTDLPVTRDRYLPGTHYV